MIIILRFLIGKGRWFCLLVLLSLTAATIYPALHIEIENDNSSMVSRNQELQQRYDIFRNSFGNDEVLLLAFTDPNLLQPTGLKQLRLIAADLNRIKGISTVTTPFMYQTPPLLPLPFAPALQHPGAAIIQLPMLLSADHQTALLLINLSADIDEQQKALITVEDLIDNTYADLDLRLSGIPLQKLTVSRLIQRDQQVLIPLSVVILSLLLLLFFRQIYGLLLPLAVMAISLCWTLALYSLSGFALNTITALLPPVIMVLSVTTTVHLYNSWLHGSTQSKDPAEHIIRVVRTLFRPCLFTTITTAMGLASLMVSNIPAVRLFGGFAALGVCLSFVAGFLLVPVLLSFLPLPHPKKYGASPLLHKILSKTATLSIDRPRLIFSCTLVLTLLAVSGIPQINNNTNLISFLKPEEKLFRDTTYIDRTIGGVNRIEFMLSRTDGHPFTQGQDFKKLAAFQDALETLPQVTGSDSLISLPKSHLEASGMTSLPGDQNLSMTLIKAALDPESAIATRFISPDQTRLRLSIRTPVMGTARTASLINEIEEMAERIFDAPYALTPTGATYQLAIDSNQLVSSLVKSFSLSLAMILAAILLMFRSFKLLSVALIPNLIPLLWTFGLMGLLAVDLSTGTAMIAAVAIGLTVDSTIHYLAGFQRVTTADVKTAIMQTTTTTGQALTISALVLFCGFAAGGASSFLPTVYFSLLTGLTMLGALICDLIVLPASLVLIDRIRARNRTC